MQSVIARQPFQQRITNAECKDGGEWMPEASLSLRRQQPLTSATPECCSKMFPRNSAWATLLPCCPAIRRAQVQFPCRLAWVGMAHQMQVTSDFKASTVLTIQRVLARARGNQQERRHSCLTSFPTEQNGPYF